MAWWKESESIYLDWVFLDMFDWLGPYKDALEDWSEERWRKEFSQALAKRNYSKENRTLAIQEFKRFLEYRKKEQKKVNNSEQKSRSREELEKKWAADTARERRKVKQIPEALEAIDEYEKAVRSLAKKPSDENYVDVFHICHYIMKHWDVLSPLEEFEGILEYYEKQALEYFYKKKNIDSLAYVVVGYTEPDILAMIRKMQDKRKWIQKGLPYVKLLYENVKNEGSADRYVNCYIMMNQYCVSGEDLEALSYADKAYKLAKKVVYEVRTEKVLETLKWAKLCMTIQYRTHEQEDEALQVEEEYERIREEILKSLSV